MSASPADLGSTTMNYTAPRNLTTEDIQLILDTCLPLENNILFVQKDPYAKKVMLENLRKQLKDQLKPIKLSPDAIPYFIQIVNLKIAKSISDPGYMVGITIAESIGEAVSQAALNSKRLTGTKDLSSGLSSLKAVLSGTMGAIAPAFIYFTNPLYTYYDIQRVAAEFLYVTLMDIQTNTRLYKRDELEDLYDAENNDGVQYWVPLYKQIKGNIPFDYGHVIRMKLDMEFIYNHQVTISSIVSAIEGSNFMNLLYCIPSPLFFDEPYIDIYVNSKGIDAIVEKETNNMVLGSVDTFFTNIFLSKDCQIKGIPHVLKLEPKSVAVKDCIMGSEKLTLSAEAVQVGKSKGVKKSQLENIFYTKLNTHYMHQHGIPLEKVIQLIEAAGMIIMPAKESSNDFLLIQTPSQPNNAILNDRKPEVILMERINKADEDQDKLFHESLRNSSMVLPALNLLYKLSRHFYAQIEMSKDKKENAVMVLIPFSRYKIIDSSRSVSGNMYENLNTIGVIGLKNYLNQRIATLLSGAGGIAVWMHIDLMTDHMCRLGHLTKFNLKGVEETSGFSSVMLWKDAVRAIESAAATGRTSNTTKYGPDVGSGSGSVPVSRGSMADFKLLSGVVRAGSTISDALVDKETEARYLREKEMVLNMAKEGKTLQHIGTQLNAQLNTLNKNLMSGQSVSKNLIDTVVLPSVDESASKNSGKPAPKKRAVKPSAKPKAQNKDKVNLDDL